MSLERERRTIEAMIEIYCRAHHAPAEGLCDQCQSLQDYAAHRLDKCPFGPDKPVCAKCPVHCYQPRQREQIREVMRYSGPRMTARHPWLALHHLLHSRKPAPQQTKIERPGTVETPEFEE